jgi:hypothetical protein
MGNMKRRSFLALLGLLPFYKFAVVEALSAPDHENYSLMRWRDLLMPAVRCIPSADANYEADICVDYTNDLLEVKLYSYKDNKLAVGIIRRASFDRISAKFHKLMVALKDATSSPRGLTVMDIDTMRHISLQEWPRRKLLS